MREVTEGVRDGTHEVAAREEKRFEVPEVTELIGMRLGKNSL